MLGAGLAGDGIRVASITIAGQIRPGTPFSPDQIAEKYWSVVQSDGTWPKRIPLRRNMISFGHLS